MLNIMNARILTFNITLSQTVAGNKVHNADIWDLVLWFMIFNEASEDDLSTLSKNMHVSRSLNT